MDVQIYLFKIIFLNHNLESKAGTNSHPCKHMDVQNDTRWHFMAKWPINQPDITSRMKELANYNWMGTTCLKHFWSEAETLVEALLAMIET
jgi:hypothetical protein